MANDRSILVCRNCMFARVSDGGKYGECRRNAPKPSRDEVRAWWPAVAVDSDWCGEFRLP